jgi:hypothetical protein
MCRYDVRNSGAGPAQQEFANGRIASLRLYDGVIVPSVPEPETYAMLLARLGLLGFLTRRKQFA